MPSILFQILAANGGNHQRLTLRYLLNVTVSYYPKHFLLEARSNYYTLPLGAIGFFWQVLELIHKFIIELHVLQDLFSKGSNKQ